MIALDLSLENLYRQYHHCRRNKRNTINALRFESEQEKNLIALRQELIDRSYKPRRSLCFFTTRPKLREILAADFRDRVVHHLLVDYLKQIWEPVFIHDSYACRKGKGVHRGVQRLQQFMRQVSANGSRPAWTLQLDIRNYLMSIDRDILFETQLVRRGPDVDCYRFDEAVLDRLAATLSSYLGHFKLANTSNLVQSLWCRFGFLSQYFAFDENNWKLIRLYPTPKACRRVRDQYRYFRWRFPDDVLFFQVGRFMECYDIGQPDWTQWLQLKRMGRNRRGARCGFPVSQTNRHLRLLLERGVAVTLIREQQRDWQQGIQVRAPVWRYCPVGCCSRKERGRIRIAYRDAGIVELYSARSDSAECRRSQKRGLRVSLVSTVLRGNPYRPL